MLVCLGDCFSFLICKYKYSTIQGQQTELLLPGCSDGLCWPQAPAWCELALGAQNLAFSSFGTEATPSYPLEVALGRGHDGHLVVLIILRMNIY
jgi:hypothetical protein